MITYIQALFLGAFQGVSELFPISSLGHTVIIPQLFGWNIDQSSPLFLTFIITTHFATSLVLLGFFFSDWVLIVKGIFRSLGNVVKGKGIDENDTYAKLGWLLVVATIPAGLLGLLLEHKIRSLFAIPLYAAFFLVLNGVMLFAIEAIRRKSVSNIPAHSEMSSDVRIAKLSWTQSLKIGLAQCIALIPGFSRTGGTLGGGLISGLNHEDAARFSFLLATPIIFAAVALKLPHAFSTYVLHPSTDVVISPSPISILIVGFVASALTAYFSVRFLTRYFKTKTLTPFAWYCVLVGVFSIIKLL